MSDTLTVADAATLTGMHEREIVSVGELDGYPLIVTKDGNGLVYVDEPVHWAGGETQLLLARPPSADYKGFFPVYEPGRGEHAEQIDDVIDAAINDEAVFGESLEGLDKKRLQDLARGHQVDVAGNAGVDKLLDALRAYAAEQTAAHTDDDTTEPPA